jgi:hypothetical protein
MNIPDAGRVPTNEPTPPAQDAAGRFIPPPVAGYKPLTPEQVALLNRAKALGAIVETEIRDLIAAGHCEEVGELDPRCVAVARTEFQTAFMWLCRAITKPGTFA